MKEIKRLKFSESHKFKKKANEEQFKFNQKLIKAWQRQIRRRKSTAREGQNQLRRKWDINFWAAETYSTGRQVRLRMSYGR